MTEYSFEAKIRKEPAKTVRKRGVIPGILYGKGIENRNLSLEKVAFLRLLKVAGTSNLINLAVEDDSNQKVLIHEIEEDPVNGEVIHVDLFKVNMKEKIKTEIPIEFVGTSPLVIEQDGSQIVNRDTVEVECLPSDLIDHITVDVSKITDFEQNVKVADLRVSDAIEILTDPEEVVVMVQPPRSEEELEALDEAVVEDVEAVEVEEHGKEEEATGEEGEVAEPPAEKEAGKEKKE